MKTRLNVPSELQHLIEKRELEHRRKGQRRSDANRRQLDAGPLSAASSMEALQALIDSVEEEPDGLPGSTGELEKLVAEDRRSGNDQRKKGERREKVRRKEDRKRTSDS